MKKKLVYIASHLSTGGMPQYLVKQIESIKEDMDVYCIEWENVTGGVLIIQRNKVVNLLGDKLITLGENKHEVFGVLDRIKPDIVHLQEIPELFMQRDVADKLYSADRTYVIIETSHDSGYNVNNKTYIPDKFLMVSMFQVEKYKVLGVPTDVVEYPIENKIRTKTREQALRDLGLDPNLKHVINVGLFTPRKNQAEIIEYARQLQNYPIQFHFIGNQADNFKFYWEPLMQNFPPNCKWWNERSDVDSFYEAADLFLFTSRGTETDRETMPLVIREALGWKIPSLIYNLPVYMGYFDKFDTIEYLTDNIQTNVYRIAEKMMVGYAPQNTINIQPNECIVISSYPTTDAATQVTKEGILQAKKFGIPIILTSHCPIPTELQDLVDYCVVDRNNILTYHTHYNRAWFYFCDRNLKVYINLPGENNHIYHGPAAYTNYYNGISFAKDMGFQHAFCWNFDVVLKNDNMIRAMRPALQTHKMIIRFYDAEEGKTLQTELLGTDTTFFLNKFPKISNENEYKEWMTNIGSESNGLENMWYHTLKNNLKEIKTWSQEDYIELFADNEHQMCSQLEYYTVLPMENDPTKVVVWMSSSHTKDGRIKNIYINNVLNETLAVTGKSNYYKIFNMSEVNVVRFEILDIVNKNILMEKTIVLDKEYIDTKLKQNGIVRYESC